MTARVLSGLLFPADPGLPLSLRAVKDSSSAISDLLGGVLLDDSVTWRVGQGVFATVYCAEDRAGLPVNQRLSVVTTRLGVTDRAFHAAARGDVLILGTTRGHSDVDVPAAVTEAARRGGYRIAPPPPRHAS